MMEGEEKRIIEANSVQKLEIASLLLYGENINYKVVPFVEGDKTSFLFNYYATDEVHDAIESKFDTFCRGLDCFPLNEKAKPIIRKYTDSGELDFTLEDMLEEIKNHIRTDYELSAGEYDTWVAPIKFYKQVDNKIFLINSNISRHDLKCLQIKFSNKFHDVIRKLYDENYEVDFISLDETEENKNKEMLISKILEQVAKTYEVDMMRMLSVERNSNLVEPRQVAMYLLNEKAGMSYLDIAKIFHKKDHTTVIHGIKKIHDKMKEDEKLVKKLYDIKI